MSRKKIQTSKNMKKILISKIAIINIYGQFWRIIFGTSGLIIAVTALVFFVSFGYGLDRIVTSQMKNENNNKLIYINSADPSTVQLNSEAAQKISEITGVVRVDEIVNLPGKFSFDGSSVEFALSATTPDYFKDNSIELPEKVELVEAAGQEAQPIIITNALAQVFDKKNPKNLLSQEVYIDYTLTKDTTRDLFETDVSKRIIEGKKFRVVAILKSGNSAYGYIPYSYVLSNGVDYASSGEVIVDDIQNIDSIRAKIEAKGFSTYSSNDTILEVQHFFGILRFILVFVSLVTIVVATIGLLNTTGTIVEDRLKEFAWLKVLGIGNLEIRFLVTMEGLFISLFSVLSGIILGLFFGMGVNIVFKILSGKNNYEYMPVFYAPVLFIIFLIVLSVLFGIAIGFITSKKTSSINPRLGVIR